MDTVLSFWFEELGPSDWFRKSSELDDTIKRRFETLHEQIMAGEMWQWRDLPQGRLAEIIVLDQFSRNMFRDSARAFASDPLALALAQEGVRCGADQKLTKEQRPFLYMPYMHSESKKVHITALELFETTGNVDYELRHKAIVDRFGRYPHRNSCLGRLSTEEETEWMKTNRGF
ncbi:MAG: DUF924 family protein [Gammaproteobacteria bacterium]